MRQSLFAAALIFATMTPAFADDVNWTGAYAGLHAGGAWGSTTVRDNAKDGVPPGPFSYDTSGAFGGGTAGYNYQYEGFVVGVEGDLGYLDLAGSGIIGSSKADHHQDITTDGGLYGDITGRVGFTFQRALIYGKGGFAFYDGEAAQATTADGFATHSTGTFTGFVVGGGVEYELSEKISVKAEFLHMDFGTQGGDQTSITDDPVGHVYSNSHTLDADSLKFGVAYHF